MFRDGRHFSSRRCAHPVPTTPLLIKPIKERARQDSFDFRGMTYRWKRDGRLSEDNDKQNCNLRALFKYSVTTLHKTSNKWNLLTRKYLTILYNRVITWIWLSFSKIGGGGDNVWHAIRVVRSWNKNVDKSTFQHIMCLIFPGNIVGTDTRLFMGNSFSSTTYLPIIIGTPTLSKGIFWMTGYH